jgi:dTDP-4-amino-4,6-dideoxy-D-galactose acyltransferase
MKKYFDLLNWDTDFFGYRIVSVRPQGLTEKESQGIIPQLRKENVRVAYCFVDPGDRNSIKIIQNLSGKLVDEKITFCSKSRKLASYDGYESVKPYQSDFPSEKLIDLALQSGIYSRFKTDPNFKNNEFEKLYTEWIIKSVKKELADEVFVSYSGIEEKGFVTAETKDNKGIIGLVAVDESERGKSIGKKLMNAALDYYYKRNIEIVEVATQKANEGACRFYKAIGFEIKSIVNVYHLWII